MSVASQAFDAAQIGIIEFGVILSKTSTEEEVIKYVREECEKLIKNFSDFCKQDAIDDMIEYFIGTINDSEIKELVLKKYTEMVEGHPDLFQNSEVILKFVGK